MQNPQQMAAMAGMNPNAGPVDGTPLMGNMARQQRAQAAGDPRENLNTYIYDYFLRNNHHRLARMMIDCDIKMNVNPPQKPSPSGRNVNGVDAMDQDSKDDLPNPRLPPNQIADNSFLLDWWVQFWDIFQAARGQQTKGSQYIAHTRNLAQMSTEQRNQRMMMSNAMGAQYQNMMRAMPNGVAPNDLKRQALNNRNPNANAMANMNQMNKQAMMSAQMQRDGSGMDMNGQRPQSPASGENAPSPNKRPRVEGGMNAGNMPSQFNEFAQQAQNAQQKNIEVYAQSLAQQQRLALNNTAIPQAMNPGVQGSPMNHQGLDGQDNMFAGNQPRAPGLPQGAPGQPQGNHALQDYQMQLMLLEQQNKKRLLMARQEQDNISGPHAQGAVGGPSFPPSMSPQGSRPGPSPNPADQMKRGTPKMPQQGLPGSPMPDGAGIQQQRNSPTPNMNFDPNQMPPGMPPQFYPQMPQTPMMRPPSSHPGNFNGQQLTPQQMEQMRQNGGMQNGAWRGPPQPGMMPNQQQQMGPMGNNPQQRGHMPPPPAPAGEQPRTQEPSPSQPAQAPPTPSQSSKPNPKKKPTKDNKKPTKKGANTGATPAATGGEEPPTPTPSTPITPMHKASFAGQNGQQQPAQPPAQPQPPAVPQQQQQPPSMDSNAPPFGNISDDPNSFDIGLSFGENEGLDNFDFDSFLHVGDESGGFGGFENFGLTDTAEVEGAL